jgi:phosphoribosylanthranilate isomerase
MRSSPGPSVKICGITRNEDARRAQEFGADLIGVVLTAGFGRSVPRSDAAGVVAGTSIERVAVLVDESPGSAAEAGRAVGASLLQLHGSEDRATVLRIREEGDWRLWKAVRARSVDDVRSVVDELADIVDGILVEGWQRGVVGGGGVELVLEPDQVREAIPAELDFVLAGGLRPATLADVVARFRPDVVDVSSGVEHDPGRKDAALVQAFVRAAGAGLHP